jgi:hypothetical protein
MELMRSIYLLAMALLFVIPTARAEERVLVEHVPGGANPAIVIAVVKQSLINRGWTIEAVDEKSVHAAINHSSNDAKLHITFLKGQLLYEGSAIKTMRSGGSGAAPAQLRAMRREGSVPTRWIEYLRRDIAGILATMPETPL